MNREVLFNSDHALQHLGSCTSYSSHTMKYYTWKKVILCSLMLYAVCGKF
jgi:hypothetical protein